MIDKFKKLNESRPSPGDDEYFSGGKWTKPRKFIYRIQFRVACIKYQTLKKEFCHEINNYDAMQGEEKKSFERKVAALEQLCSLIIFSMRKLPSTESHLYTPISAWSRERLKEITISDEVIFEFK